MTTPIGPVPPLPPSARVPAMDSSVQSNVTATQLIQTILGSPTQEGTLGALLTQIIESGAQPWVPNVQSASILEQPPGFATIGQPTAPFRVWGGYVSCAFTASSGFTGNSFCYAKVYVNGSTQDNQPNGPPLIVAHVELGVGGASQADSDTCSMQMPGVPIPANTKLILDVNGNSPVPQAEIRASGNILYSIP